MMKKILFAIAILVLFTTFLVGCTTAVSTSTQTITPSVSSMGVSSTPPSSFTATQSPIPTSTAPGTVQTDIPLVVTFPSDAATLNSDTITVTGHTAPGATVRANDQTAVADVNGNFSIPITLETGPNAIDVVANDNNGHQGEELILVNVELSGAQSIGATGNNTPSATIDSQGNLILNVTSPLDGATLGTTSVKVTGQTAPGATVIVNDQTVTADNNGNFSIPLVLDVGSNVIDVVAMDNNGNEGEVVLLVNAG